MSVEGPIREPVAPPLEAPQPIVVNGAGVVADGPVIETAPVPTVTIPPNSRRRLAESIVLFLSAILFLRTMTVEPFGVPTGSMSPTLIGNHRAIACYRCSFPVRVGEPSHKHQMYPTAHCPNCGAVGQDIANAPDVSGDRLLVDKNTYRLRSPRRWELAVFICPSDRSKPYVKRVVGRPGESVQVIDGDVWIDGRLARKSLAEARGCKVSVFEMDYSPPGGWAECWIVSGQQPALNGAVPPASPEWLNVGEREIAVNGEGADQPRLVSYWHVSPDSHAPEVIRDGLEYNGHSSPSWDEAVHDLFLDVEVEPTGGEGAIVLTMTDGSDVVTIHLAVGGELGESKLLLPPKGQVKGANRKPLQVGKKYRVEAAFVDRRISVAVDGREYFSHDLPEVGRRADLTSPFSLGAMGTAATFRHVRLSRDIYYRPGKHGGSTPYQLDGDEYFLLGDNSTNSDDSRSWPIPGVPERNFIGKPFLLHQPSRPASWGINGRGATGQAVDWSRVGWLK